MSDFELLQPKPKRSLKRSLNALDPELQEPKAKRRCQEELSIRDWADHVALSIEKSRTQSVPATALPSKAVTGHPQSQSVPPEFHANLQPPTVEDLLGRPKCDDSQAFRAVEDLERPESRSAINEMGDRRDNRSNRSNLSRRDNDSFSQFTNEGKIPRGNVESRDYRNILEHNGVRMDLTGDYISPTVQSLLDSQILKKRTSPPLPQNILRSTRMDMNQWGNSTENAYNQVMSSAMFPVRRPGLNLGGNSQWSTAALPPNPDFPIAISTPKPDYHLGYANDFTAGFTDKQAYVLSHPHSKSYLKPGTDNSLPFLTFELKSEATGGNLYVAENQAAGSGTCSLRAVQWLFDQTGSARSDKLKDIVTFSIAASGRVAVLSVHWRSEKDKKDYMSHVKSFLTTELEHIQQCHDAVKNIIDYGVGARRTGLGEALEALFPLSQQWSKRSARAAELDGTVDVIVIQSKRKETSRYSDRASGTHSDRRDSQWLDSRDSGGSAANGSRRSNRRDSQRLDAEGITQSFAATLPLTPSTQSYVHDTSSRSSVTQNTPVSKNSKDKDKDKPASNRR